jgi:hypothetical protein
LVLLKTDNWGIVRNDVRGVDLLENATGDIIQCSKRAIPSGIIDCVSGHYCCCADASWIRDIALSDDRLNVR